MKNNLGQKILNFETNTNFRTHWYSIFLNPYFINRNQIYKAIKQLAKQTNFQTTILDVGCGIKPYRHLFLTKKYIGIDIEGGGHSQSQKNIDKFFDGHHIPYDTEQFDLVISTQVFEHVENLEALVGEIKRVLKKDGQLFITMPLVWDEHEKPYDFRRFTSFGHRQILENNGFKVISTTKTTGIFATVGQLFSAFFVELFSELLDKMKLKFRYSYPLKKIFTLIICFPIQFFALFFDFIFARKGITLDYIIIAKKNV